jgi:PAS domain S-box-containing protein
MMEEGPSRRKQLVADLAAAHQRIAELEATESQRRRAEQSLGDLLAIVEQAKQEWESTVDSIPELVCLIDSQARIIRTNRTVEIWDLASVEEVGGRGLHDLLHPHCTEPICYLQTFWNEIEDLSGSREVFEREAYYKALGRHLLIRAQSCTSRGPGSEFTVLVMCDITERKRAEAQREQLQAQLLRAQKMEAVGRLASGVAHEFANLLTAIMGYGQLLLRELRPIGIGIADVHQIMAAGVRASDLTDQLLTLGRPPSQKLQTLDLNQMISSMMKLLGCLCGGNVELCTILDPDLVRVRADADQIRQVIMNLVENAHDAMRQGGRITLRTENIGPADHQGVSSLQASSGNAVRLSVSDTGKGMDTDTIDHLFEPFFTTKTTGTGLGLTVVYGIVQQHRGWIDVDSTPGQGSTISVCLPAIATDWEDLVEEMDSLEDPVVPLSGDPLVMLD